jgi:hypothetical protein
VLEHAACLNAYEALTIAILLSLSAMLNRLGQGTAFTYQGRLNDNGALASGIYDLRFTIYGSAGGATVMAGPLTGPPVPVTKGATR